ncbi:hypothetical protein KEM54_006759 [Ascosphaera aggregata]|nr:hypothetical protein KEM54_006759 [Ascosphaera aggregata]
MMRFTLVLPVLITISGAYAYKDKFVAFSYDDAFAYIFADESDATSCDGFLFAANKDDCVDIRDHQIQADTTYADGAHWGEGHCYISYSTNASGPHPLKGQKVIDTVNTIMDKCSKKLHGSYGTGQEDCEDCHVTVNYKL